MRVTVRVHVEPAGNISSAELDSPGPSKYFADLALRAARRWEFTPRGGLSTYVFARWPSVRPHSKRRR